MKTLKDKILEELTIDSSRLLEESFDQIKKYLRITPAGAIQLLNVEKLTGEEQLILYMIGKTYAKEAGLVVSDAVSNAEFMAELTMPKGSLLPGLKKLRDAHKVHQIKTEGGERGSVAHYIALPRIKAIVSEIVQKTS